ncbi:MAG: hypothetical protein Tsb0021_10700 [Chlamydiales bacterium]
MGNVNNNNINNPVSGLNLSSHEKQVNIKSQSPIDIFSSIGEKKDGSGQIHFTATELDIKEKENSLTKTLDEEYKITEGLLKELENEILSAQKKIEQKQKIEQQVKLYDGLISKLEKHKNEISPENENKGIITKRAEKVTQLPEVKILQPNVKPKQEAKLTEPAKNEFFTKEKQQEIYTEFIKNTNLVKAFTKRNLFNKFKFSASINKEVAKHKLLNIKEFIKAGFYISKAEKLERKLKDVHDGSKKEEIIKKAKMNRDKGEKIKKEIYARLFRYNEKMFLLYRTLSNETPANFSYERFSGELNIKDLETEDIETKVDDEASKIEDDKNKVSLNHDLRKKSTKSLLYGKRVPIKTDKKPRELTSSYADSFPPAAPSNVGSRLEKINNIKTSHYASITNAKTDFDQPLKSDAELADQISSYLQTSLGEELSTIAPSQESLKDVFLIGDKVEEVLKSIKAKPLSDKGKDKVVLEAEIEERDLAILQGRIKPLDQESSLLIETGKKVSVAVSQTRLTNESEHPIKAVSDAVKGFFITQKLNQAGVHTPYGVMIKGQDVYFVSQKADSNLREEIENLDLEALDDDQTRHHIKVGIAIEIGESLLKMHKAGFVHRDLGLRNVLVFKDKTGNEKDQYKLIDFDSSGALNAKMSEEQLPAHPSLTSMPWEYYTGAEKIESYTSTEWDKTGYGAVIYEMWKGKTIAVLSQTSEYEKNRNNFGNWDFDGIPEPVVEVIKGLYEHDKSKRMTIETAVEKLKQFNEIYTT